MTLRDHRSKAKQWSYGRAQLSAASAAAHYGKRRTKLTAKRVKAGEREQLQRAPQCCLNNDTGCYDAACSCRCEACVAVRKGANDERDK